MESIPEEIYRQVVVTSCGNCMFREDVSSGHPDPYCSLVGDKLVGALLALRNEPLPEVPPDWCPLRLGSVAITLEMKT